MGVAGWESRMEALGWVVPVGMAGWKLQVGGYRVGVAAWAWASM